MTTNDDNTGVICASLIKLGALVVCISPFLVRAQDEPTAPALEDRLTITVSERRLWDAIRRRGDFDDPQSLLVADFLDYGHDAHPIDQRQIAGYDALQEPSYGLWATQYADWIKWRDAHPKQSWHGYVYDWDRVKEPKGLTATHKRTFASLVAKRRDVLNARNAQWRKESDADRQADAEFFQVTK